MIAISLLLAFLVPIAAFSNVRTQLESSVHTFSSKRWNNFGSADSDVIHATIVIKRDESVVKKFEEQLFDLSNPSSPNYGKWLTKKEIIAQISPSADSLKLVTDFLASQNILPENIRISDYQDKVFVKIPSAAAAALFDTEFARFRSTEDPSIVIVRATKPYSLPSDVAEVVSLVDNLIRFPAIRRSNRVETPSSNITDVKATSPFLSCGTSCPNYVTPTVLQQAYSFSPVTKVTAGNSVAVAEFQYQYYDDADLQAFSSACDVTTEITTVIGGNKASVCNAGCVEALLDIEHIGAITNPIPLTTIYSGTYSLLDWADGLNSMTNPPLVNSLSYGNDEVQQTSTAYMQECNTAFMVSGTLGLSLIAASGDQGVWGRSGVGATFNPDFPGGSPYITVVGGTDFAVKSTIGAETTWDCGGGGFSDTFTIPSYQSTQVAAYLAAATAAGVLPKASLFNSKGRAYPDVAALGGGVNPYCVAIGGGSGFSGVYGTSAACPVVAGIFAQLNNVRLAAGKPSLGFLNPLIYANPTCFQDINDGSQNNCNAGTTGFAALDGWDPATGNGSPNYSCLAKVVVA